MQTYYLIFWGVRSPRWVLLDQKQGLQGYTVWISSRRESVSLLFPTSRGCPVSLARGPFLKGAFFKADDVASSSLLLILTLFLSSHLLPFCASIFKKIVFGLTVQYAVSQFPNQGLNLCPPQQKGRVLTTGPPGKSPSASILKRPLWLHWAYSDNPGYPCHQNS